MLLRQSNLFEYTNVFTLQQSTYGAYRTESAVKITLFLHFLFLVTHTLQNIV